MAHRGSRRSADPAVKTPRQKEASRGAELKTPPTKATIVRHESEAPTERSTCGCRYKLISTQDRDAGVAAWAHVVDIDGAQEHYHKVGTEVYYVLEGEGSIRLDGTDHPIRKGSIVHIPPGVVHGAKGRMRVLVVGIPDISDDDLFLATENP